MKTQPKLTIRQATKTDISAIANFNINMAFETEGLKLIPQTISNGVSAIMSHPERGFYLVVEANGENKSPLIVASLMVTTEWSDWRNANFWWIQSVYVVKQWRRKGIYKMLYAEVQRLAKQQQNVCGFRLYVEQANTIAQKTYRALGMQTTHYLMFEQTIPDIKLVADQRAAKLAQSDCV